MTIDDYLHQHWGYYAYYIVRSSIDAKSPKVQSAQLNSGGKNENRVVIAALVSSTLTFAADCGKSPTDKACQKDYVKDTKIVVGDTYADPGKSTQKDAKENCCYQKAVHKDDFEKKYGSDKPSTDNKQPTKVREQ